MDGWMALAGARVLVQLGQPMLMLDTAKQKGAERCKWCTSRAWWCSLDAHADLLGEILRPLAKLASVPHLL